MHLPSDRHRSEFLACPQLVRFTMAQGGRGLEATLLIKSLSLSLKYLVRVKRLHLLVFIIRGKWLAYGVQINDDSKSPAVVWSLVQYQDELEALRTLTERPKCVVFLFNEVAANVAWGELDIDLSAGFIRSWIDKTSLYPETAGEYPAEINEEISKSIDLLLLTDFPESDGRVVQLEEVSEWHPVSNHYFTNSGTASLLSLFETDEGRQQEEIAHWLVDNLKPSGVIRNPQVQEVAKFRELSDLLLSYEYGAFLIESKTLSILTRETLPDRERLGRNIRKHIGKAVGQLIGGVKNLRRGCRITDVSGRDITVEREQPPHLIVLVPDLSLLSGATEFGGKFFVETTKESGGGFLHILDPPELLRIVQAAEIISRQSKATSVIMAFDYYLIERWKYAVKAETPDFAILLRVEGEANKPDSISDNQTS